MKRKILKLLSAFVCSFAFFSVFFLTSSAQERAVPDPVPGGTKTLSAGWYIFYDVLTVPDVFDSPNVDVSGAYGENVAFNSYYVNNSNFSYLSGIQFTFSDYGGLLINYVFQEGDSYNSILVYENGWLNTPPDIIGSVGDSSFQYVIIPNDTVCSSAFVDWFNANTYKYGDGGVSLIAKGSYVGSIATPPTLPNGAFQNYARSIYLDFSYRDKQLVNHSFTYMDISYHYAYDDSTGQWNLPNLTIEYKDVMLEQYDEWAYDYINNVEEGNVDGWINSNANYITVNQDCYVPTEFYNLFAHIYEPIGEYEFIYNQGYKAGELDGVELGMDIGYRDGYNDGYSDGKSGYSNVVAPFVSGVIGMLDQFILFGGFSLLDFFTSLISVMAMIWLLKLVAGG